MDALAAIQNLSDGDQFSELRERLFGKGVLASMEDFTGFVTNQLQRPNSNAFLHNTLSDDFNESSSSSSSSLGPLQTAKWIEFRGKKVAGFEVNGKEMICLPQVYEIFLKNMVGGLHTVYTKLRRLDINPIICNVEQVRSLRGLGAIQPGVNRCKLIESKDFEKLYDDCTNMSTRPGRPSKRVGGGFEDWTLINNNLKKERCEESPFEIQHTSSTAAPSVIFNHLLPQFTTQQLLVQHFVAMNQKAANRNFERMQNEEEEVNERASDDVTPLNLSKSGSGNSENDSDSLENIRKEDSSSNNSISDRGGSNSNSLSTESNTQRNTDESNLVTKVLSLIEIASENLKHERQELWRERSEIQQMRDNYQKVVQNEQELRNKLNFQVKKCHSFAKKYKSMRRELSRARAEIRRNTDDASSSVKTEDFKDNELEQ